MVNSSMIFILICDAVWEYIMELDVEQAFLEDKLR